MSTKKKRPLKVAGAKERLIAQREAEAEAARRRRRSSAVTLVVIVAVILAAASLYGWYQAAKNPSAGATSSASASATVTYAAVNVLDSTGLVIGLASAPHTVTIYSDFSCEHCAEFETTYGAMLASLQQSGRIDIEYYPLGFGSDGSARAANAMACAAERDPAFAVNLYDAFFANYGTNFSNDQIITLSSQLKTSLPDGYETCVTSGTHSGWVTGNYTTAKTGKAANGTPAVYVDGTAFDLTTGSSDSLEALLS